MGKKAEIQWQDGTWIPGVVDAKNPDGSYSVRYDGFPQAYQVAESDLRELPVIMSEQTAIF